MNAWIEHKARRLLIVGALAFAVGIPTIACTGGGEEASDDDDAGDDDDAPEEFDAADAIQGSWQVQPHKDDLRQLKIIDMAMKPKIDKKKFKAKLKPPPSADEEKMFDEIRKLDKNSPDVKFMKSMIKMMKNARLDIDDSTYKLTVEDDTQTMQYEITDKGENTAKIKLSNGPGGDEKHELTWDGNDKIDVKITEPRPQNLVFKRK